jgi:hypothetical protein
MEKLRIISQIPILHLQKIKLQNLYTKQSQTSSKIKRKKRDCNQILSNQKRLSNLRSSRSSEKPIPPSHHSSSLRPGATSSELSPSGPSSSRCRETASPSSSSSTSSSSQPHRKPRCGGKSKLRNPKSAVTASMCSPIPRKMCPRAKWRKPGPRSASSSPKPQDCRQERPSQGSSPRADGDISSC